MKRLFLFAFFNWLSQQIFVIREDKLSRIQDKIDGMAGKYDPYADAPKEINGSRRKNL